MARTPHPKVTRRHQRVQQARSTKSVRDKTPPPAQSQVDGIHGFMFTSPKQRSHKKLIHTTTAATTASGKSGRKEQAVRRLFTDQSAAADTTTADPPIPPSLARNSDKSAAQRTKVEDTLFSPYRCAQRHSYNTRFMASLRQQIDEHDEVKVLNDVVSAAVNDNSTRFTEQISVTTTSHDHMELVVDENNGVLSQLRVHEEASTTVRSRSEDTHNRFVLSAEDMQAYEHGEFDISDLRTEEAIDSYLLINRLAALPQFLTERHRHVLPASHDHQKITLVLDLDETMVHCTTEVAKLPRPDLNFTVNFQDREFQVFVQIRPFLKEFLELASSMFELVIFTASQQIYADKLLDLLDPGRQFTKHRLFRDSCVQVEGTFVKDLRVLGRDLSRVIIVDNAVEAFSYQINNGIPIKSWFAEEEDRELIKLLRMLSSMESLPDVRPYLRNRFRVEDLIVEACRLSPVSF